MHTPGKKCPKTKQHNLNKQMTQIERKGQEHRSTKKAPSRHPQQFVSSIGRFCIHSRSGTSFWPKRATKTPAVACRPPKHESRKRPSLKRATETLRPRLGQHTTPESFLLSKASRHNSAIKLPPTHAARKLPSRQRELPKHCV